MTTKKEDSENKEKKPQNNRIFYWLGLFIIIGLLALTGQYLYWKYIADPVYNNIVMNPNNDKLNSAIEDYKQWVATLSDKKMDVDHELTKTGLLKIANVLTLMPDTSSATTHSKNQADILQIKSLADSITYNWKSGKHADMIKKAFSTTAKVITNLGYKKVSLAKQEMLELELKTGAIDPKTLTLDQRGSVKAVFEQVCNVFQKLK